MKSHNLQECLNSIHSLEKSCIQRFKPKACENIQQYYVRYCYNKFENTDTCSSVKTLGADTLNRINKSPSPPSL